MAEKQVLFLVGLPMSFIKDDSTRAVTEMRTDIVQGRCPRCSGNVYLDRDCYGWYEQCLQCGFICDLEGIIGTRKKVHERVSVS